jgi:DNA-binding SARP family transcriptional activator
MTGWEGPSGPDGGPGSGHRNREDEKALNLELLAEVWGEDRVGIGGRLGIDPAIDDELDVVRSGSGGSLGKAIDEEQGFRRSAITHALPSGVVVEARVLGPVEVVGWRTLPDRRIITELCCYLALHPERPVLGEELIAAIWPDGGREASPKSLRTYLSLLRSALGADLFPESVKGAGYQLDPAVSTDWYSFQAFQLDGATAGRDDGAMQALILRQALRLVRGTPFAGVVAGTFGWAWTELLVSRMEQEIAAVAAKLADLSIASGDHRRSAWAAERGLSAVPFDESLWRRQLTAAAADSAGSLERAWRDCRAVLRDDAMYLEDHLASLR